MRRLVLDQIRDLAESLQRNLAGPAIDRRADVVFMAIFGAAGLLDRLLHGLDHFVAVDVFFARDLVGDLQ